LTDEVGHLALAVSLKSHPPNFTGSFGYVDSAHLLRLAGVLEKDHSVLRHGNLSTKEKGLSSWAGRKQVKKSVFV